MASCTICHKKLTDRASIRRGMGAECAAKYQSYLTACNASDAELAALRATGDSNVQRFVTRFIQATNADRLSEASSFINYARRLAGEACAV